MQEGLTNKGLATILVLALILALFAQIGRADVGQVVGDLSDLETSRGVFETGEWPWPPGGTIGFWKNWDAHKTYTRAQINCWLAAIDQHSQWLVPDVDCDGGIDVDDMVQIMQQGAGPNKEKQFIAQYLATQLNLWSGRLHPGATHDFGAQDPDNYLGLNGSGTLAEIVSAIESKYGALIVKFETMKNIYDALNNAEI